ncbi:MAG: UDP-3-O-acyl-N-acetylglucosamine deacetylase [Planctomycetota bacterium]|nr:UDP-3-O-acyl-N-acetylglucosamine deacetylase [Planctomycetota bacterium]
MNPPPPAPPRRTLATPAVVQGIGLFTEHPATCTIAPADAGTGVRFCRTDLPGSPTVPATIASLADRPVHPAFASIPPRHTAVASSQHPDAIVYTTEHLLAALLGMGVTDATIEINTNELPIGDGSALLFTDAITAAGLRDVANTTPADTIAPLTLDAPITVTSPDRRASITAEPLGPHDTPSYRYQLDYGPAAPIPPQHAEWCSDTSDFLDRIAPARTFSLAAEAQQMQALGLFRSFTPRDLLVIDDTGAPINNTWRSEAEPARHKLLDLIGDLALVGRPLHARVVATHAGHALNHAMARALVAAGHAEP